jgi:hypothetical protein
LTYNSSLIRDRISLKKMWCILIFSLLALTSCASENKVEPLSWDQAKWFWHPDVDPMATNHFTYFQNKFHYDGDGEIKAYFSADAIARLYINGEIVRRKVTRYHPSKVRPEEIQLSKYLKNSENEILIMHHNWGDIKNFQRDEIRRGGMMFFAPDIPALQSNWKTARARHFTEHEQQIIGVIGDLRIRFPLIIDGALRDAPLDWQEAVVVDDGPWTLSHDYYPKGQHEEFKSVQSLIAAGYIEYPEDFIADANSLKNDVRFPRFMQQATYHPDQLVADQFQNFLNGSEARITLKEGQTAYVSYDLHVPIHGYPSFELESNTEGVAVSFGYGELNVSPYDGSHHVDATTGWIKTEGVVGPFYGDRYLTSGIGREIVEIPEERTARYMTVHFTALEDSTITLHKLGIVKSQYPVDWRGSFDAEDEIIDQIIALSKIHAEITMSDVYIDTPGREDGQWLEDIRLRALLAQSWAGDIDLRYLTLAHSQESSIDGGRFLSFAPQSFIDLVAWDWGMQWITMLHDHLKWIAMTDQKDAKVKADYFADVLKRYVDLLLGQLDEKGLFRANEMFADIRVGSHVKQPEDVSVITHTWLIKRLQQAIEIATWFDIEGADIKRWTDAREKMIVAFHDHLVVIGDIPYAADVLYADENRLEGRSQAAQLSAIEAGLFEKDHASELLSLFFTTPVGQAPETVTPWNNPTYLYRSIKALSDLGMGELAMAHLKWRQCPYLPGSPDNLTPENLQGPFGGPLPEYYVRHEDIGLELGEVNTAQPCDPTGSHGWGAVGMTWLHDSVLGVTWGKAGFDDQMLTIEPVDVGKENISGIVITPWGEVVIEISENILNVTLPNGTIAKVKAACETCKQAGDYVLVDGGARHTLELDR